MSSNTGFQNNFSTLVIGGLAYLLGRNSTINKTDQNPDNSDQTSYIYKRDGLFEKIIFDDYDSQNQAEKVIKLFDKRLLGIALGITLSNGFYASNKRYYVKRILEAFNQYIFGNFTPNSSENGIVRVKELTTLPVTRNCTLKVNAYNQSNAWLSVDNSLPQFGDLSLGTVNLNLPPRSSKMSGLRMNIILDILKLAYFNISQLVLDDVHDRSSILDLLNSSIEQMYNDDSIVSSALRQYLNTSISSEIVYLGLDTKNIIIRFTRSASESKFTDFKKRVYSCLGINSY